jgi:hypothetical protein
MATATVINTDSQRVIEINPTCQNRQAIVLYDLPFKIRITNIKVPGYSPTDVPPIGLAIVGLNNYIL